jgi:hypothetical protein
VKCFSQLRSGEAVGEDVQSALDFDPERVARWTPTSVVCGSRGTALELIDKPFVSYQPLSTRMELTASSFPSPSDEAKAVEPYLQVILYKFDRRQLPTAQSRVGE